MERAPVGTRTNFHRGKVQDLTLSAVTIPSHYQTFFTSFRPTVTLSLCFFFFGECRTLWVTGVFTRLSRCFFVLFILTSSTVPDVVYICIRV